MPQCCRVIDYSLMKMRERRIKLSEIPSPSFIPFLSLTPLSFPLPPFLLPSLHSFPFNSPLIFHSSLPPLPHSLPPSLPPSLTHPSTLGTRTLPRHGGSDPLGPRHHKDQGGVSGHPPRTCWGRACKRGTAECAVSAVVPICDVYCL
jgi:hypothetical protein